MVLPFSRFCPAEEAIAGAVALMDMSRYGHLGLKKLGAYSLRMFLLGSHAGVCSGLPDGYAEHMQEFGPRRVLLAQGDDILRFSMEDRETEHRLREEFARGRKVLFFAPSEDADRFLRHFGLADEMGAVGPQSLTSSYAAAKGLDDKLGIRQIMRTHPLAKEIDWNGGVFPAYEHARSREKCWRKVKRMLRRHGAIVLKRADFDGGEGMAFIRRDKGWKKTCKRFLASYCDGKHDMLIERAISGAAEISAQWYIPHPSEGAAPHFMFLSKQYVKNGHQGNAISTRMEACFPVEWASEQKRQAAEEAYRVSFIFALVAKSLGYHGILGVDFLVRLENGVPHVYALEVNARVTAATFLYLALRRFLQRRGLAHGAAAMRKCKVPFAHWQEGLALLQEAGRCLDPKRNSGTVIAMPESLPYLLPASFDVTMSGAEHQLGASMCILRGKEPTDEAVRFAMAA